MDGDTTIVLTMPNINWVLAHFLVCTFVVILVVVFGVAVGFVDFVVVAFLTVATAVCDPPDG